MLRNLFFFILAFIAAALFFRIDNVSAQVATSPNFKVAFIGDSAAGSNFQSVLNLIKAEGAGMVLHQGDFSYDGTGTWINMIDSTLGSNFPYLGSIGNHDTNNWGDIGSGCTNSTFAGYFKCKLEKMGVTPELTGHNELYAITYKGLRIVFVNNRPDLGLIGANWVDQKLTGDNHIWKVCSWHKNQEAMQVGGRVDQVGWEAYENCRKHGAIVATGHEHSYERTKTLTSTQNQTVDPSCSDRNNLCVDPGRTFVFVSGSGGHSIRGQKRCLPTTYPYGCKGEWAMIYTTAQGANYGALFIEFNVGGNPNRAHGYFKNINGQIIDDFYITKGGSTPPRTPTPTSGGTKLGDLDKDGDVDIFDYNLLVENFGNTSCVNIADIDGNCKVDIFDYNILIENFGR